MVRSSRKVGALEQSVETCEVGVNERMRRSVGWLGSASTKQTTSALVQGRWCSK